MGVWIETVCLLRINVTEFRHTLYGCVDWNSGRARKPRPRPSHTLYGCVDWNKIGDVLIIISESHTLYGCVDWNSGQDGIYVWHQVTPCMGVWIETEARTLKYEDIKSHPVWVCGLKPF